MANRVAPTHSLDPTTGLVPVPGPTSDNFWFVQNEMVHVDRHNPGFKRLGTAKFTSCLCVFAYTDDAIFGAHLSCAESLEAFMEYIENNTDETQTITVHTIGEWHRPDKWNSLEYNMHSAMEFSDREYVYKSKTVPPCTENTTYDCEAPWCTAVFLDTESLELHPTSNEHENVVRKAERMGIAITSSLYRVLFENNLRFKAFGKDEISSKTCEQILETPTNEVAELWSTTPDWEDASFGEDAHAFANCILKRTSTTKLFCDPVTGETTQAVPASRIGNDEDDLLRYKAPASGYDEYCDGPHVLSP